MAERIQSVQYSKEDPSEFSEAYVFIGPATSGKTSIGDIIEAGLGEEVLKIRGKDMIPYRSMELSRHRRKVPDDEFIPVFREVLDSITQDKVIFENIPRTAVQATEIVQWAEKKGFHLNVVIMNLSEEDVVERAADRLVCPNCDSTYNPSVKPSRVEGICDLDNNSLVRKPGDDEGDLRRQYLEYLENLEEIAPVFLNADSASFYDFDARSTIADLGERVSEKLLGKAKP
jgi:adenylate kinase family enzyme